MSDLSNLSDKELIRLSEANKVSTVGEDLSSLWQGIKNFPVKEHLASAIKHPGQALSGLAPAVGSTIDLPAFLINAGKGAVEYGAEKFTGKRIPEDIKNQNNVPYYGHDLGTGIADLLAGKPQTKEEGQARFAGELPSSFINPKNLALKAGGKLSSLNPTKVETFKAAGINPTLADVSNSGVVKTVQNAVQSTPLGNLRGAAREKQLESFFSGLEPITLEETGSLVKSGAKAYNEKATKISDKLYERAWKNIDTSAPVDLSDTLKKIDLELQAITPEAREVLKDSAYGKVISEFRDDIIANNGSLPFSDLKKVYKGKLNNLIDTWGMVGKGDQAALKKIYNSINDDMNKYVLAVDPTAAKDLKKADKFWSDYSDKNRGIANKNIAQKKDTLSFKQMRNNLEIGETRPAQVLTSQMNKAEKRTFTDTFINEQGKNAEGVFDGQTWANRFNKMPKKAQLIALSGLEKPQAGKFMKIADALANVKETKKFGNASGTARSAAGLAAVAGLAIDPLTTIGLAIGNGIAGEAFSNPKFIDALYEATKANSGLQAKSILARAGISLQENNKSNETQSQTDNYRNLNDLSDEELIKLSDSNRALERQGLPQNNISAQ